MIKVWSHYKLSPTRYQLPAEYVGGNKVSDECNIFYGHQKNVGWRFVVQNDGYAQYGCIYPTKDELLSDLPRFASQWAKEWQ